MTPLPPNADELVSAYLDNEATPEEVAIVESNDELMERVQVLRSMSDMLSAPIDPAPPALREQHLSAALSAFDDLMGSSSESTAPPLAAVASAPAPVQERTPAETPPTTVTSLDQARERRKPRKFNGLIAAAAAAMLLFVGITALSVGRSTQGSLEVADTASTSDMSIEASASSDDAMDDEEAMEDDAAMAERGSALNSVGGAAPEAASEPAEMSMDDEEAMEDDAAMADEAMDEMAEAPAAAVQADEEAMEEEAEEELADVESDADSAGDAASEPEFSFFLGQFDADDDLAKQVEELTPLDLDERLSNASGQGLFSDCRLRIRELAGAQETLIGQAQVGDSALEIHLVPSDTTPRTLLVVDPDGCRVVNEIQINS